MNARVTYYNAPRDFIPDSFVDPVQLPTPAIRLIAPPNAKSGHSIAAELCRSLGVTRDNFTKRTGTTHLYAAVQAWSLAHGIRDVYIAHTEDLAEAAVLDLIDLTGALGARLHLIYSHSQVYAHSDRLRALGVPVAPFTTLPDPLRKPPPTALAPVSDPPHPLHGLDLPDDQWPTFRASYLQLLAPGQGTFADKVYLYAYDTVRAAASEASTAPAIEARREGLEPAWQPRDGPPHHDPRLRGRPLPQRVQRKDRPPPLRPPHPATPRQPHDHRALPVAAHLRLDLASSRDRPARQPHEP